MAVIQIEECQYTEGGTGWRVWPCALLLSCWLAANEVDLGLRTKGVRVLELGCGLGLPGLTAAALGAAKTVLTDCLPLLLRTTVRNAKATTLPAGSEASVALLDWDTEAPIADGLEEHFSTEQGVKATQLSFAAATVDTQDTEFEPIAGPCAERFSLILASDVVYSRRHALQLAVVVARRIDREGHLAAMLPVRSEEHTRCFLCGLQSAGLHIRITRVDREWVEGVTAAQGVQGEEASITQETPIASGWTEHVARNGRSFWHDATSKQSVWTNPVTAASWRTTARAFNADFTQLTEGEILFVLGTSLGETL